MTTTGSGAGHLAELQSQPTCSVDQAAATLGVSRGYAYRLVKEGGLPVIRVGKRLRVPTAHLLNLIEGATPDTTARGGFVSTHDIASAREALAPIRELHRKRTAGGEAYCGECCHMIGDDMDLTYQPWPCATAEQAFTSEELTR